MPSAREIKETVRQRYAQQAQKAADAVKECCTWQPAQEARGRSYYPQDELTLLPVQAVQAACGCGNPLAVAELRPGEVVLDLGSGGGIDVLLSAKRVGPTGKAYGLDMTDEMLTLARENQRQAGITNAEFLKGEMENIPLPDASVDVVISNCVINLSPDKDRVLKEAFRVLRPGGRLAIVDIVVRGEMPPGLKRSLELWASCIAGALPEEEYRQKLQAAGFADITVEVTQEYTAKDVEGTKLAELMRQYSPQQGDEALGSFVSAIVRARKPGAAHAS